MKRIPRSTSFNCLYGLIDNHNFQEIENKDLSVYGLMLSKLTSFEGFIIATRLVDCCAGANKNILKSGNIKDTLISPLIKKCNKYFDISFDGSYDNSYFNRNKWDMLTRINGIKTINTKTGVVEDTAKMLQKWKAERSKESFKYARFILDYVTDGKISQDLYYSSGTDYLGDMQYFLIGSIYSVFDVEIDVPEHIKIIYLSVLADHLEIYTFKKWEKRSVIDYFMKNELI